MPDPRKGERVILVTQREGAARGDFVAYARSKGISELMFPAEVVVLERLPLLGSGKIDFAAVAKFARERDASSVSVERPITKMS